jgi:hypothetical protein
MCHSSHAAAWQGSQSAAQVLLETIFGSEADVLPQLAGLEELAVLAVTEPSKILDAELSRSPSRTDRGSGEVRSDRTDATWVWLFSSEGHAVSAWPRVSSSGRSMAGRCRGWPWRGEGTRMRHFLLVRTISCGGKWLASAWM